jgi:hypothetical protein
MGIVVGIAVGSVKNYTENWAPDLGTDTITGTPSWAFNLPGPTVTGQSNTATSATVVIQAPLGSVSIGAFYELTCTITTASGLRLSKTFVIEVLATEYI